MTSEGYPVSPDRAYQDGYGMFEAPPAPEEFPVFTAGTPSPFPVFGSEEPPAAPVDGGPEAPGAFGGFPPDGGEVSVPAPAIVPLPSAYAEPSYSESAYPEPAYPEPAYPPESVYPGPAYSEPSAQDSPPAWQSFAPSGPPPAEAPQPDTAGSWAFEIPEANSTGWSPFGGDPPDDLYSSAEQQEYRSVFDEPAAAPAPAPPPPAPAPASPATFSDGSPEPPPATGTVAKASVPVASRVSPPPDGVRAPARGKGRVYGSATSQPPPATPPAAAPAAPATPPGPPPSQLPPSQVPPPIMAGQPDYTARNGYHPQGPGWNSPAPVSPAQPPAPPAQSGTTARASVSVGRVTPEVPAPTSPAPPTVYGRPAQPSVYGTPTPTVHGAPAQAPTSAAQSGPGVPAPQRPVETSAQRPTGMPAYSDLLGPARPPAPPLGPPAIPTQRVARQQVDGDQGRSDNFRPEPEPSTPAKGGTAKVLVMVIGACILLIGLAFGALWAVGKLVGSGTELAVGQCVQRQATTAVVVDCATADSFKITKKVTNQQDCPNPQNDALTQGGDVFCLEPNTPAPIS